MPCSTSARHYTFGIESASDGSQGLALAMLAADSDKRGLFFSDLDKVAIDCRIPVRRCATCKASALGLAHTSRTEPERDHRPFVFGYGTEDLPDHLA